MDIPEGIDIPLSEIRIISGINDEGHPVIATSFTVHGTDDLIGWLEGLGLIEAAKQDFIERHATCECDDE